MQQQRTSGTQLAIMIGLVLGAGLLGYVIATLGRDTSAPDADTTVATSPAAAPSPVAAASRPAGAPGGPTPTFVPTEPNGVTPSVPPSSGSEPTAAAPPPTSAPEPPPTSAPEPPNEPVRASRRQVTLEDTAWLGGFRQARGYGGRSATWIYGTGTEYSSMEVVFDVDGAANGVATLTIEGMDSEDRAKTPIRISVNRRTIYEGPNPLPNDDMPLESGTWASAAFEFDAGLLQAGSNTIRIDNLKPGRFSLPPFFMLDYATIAYAAP